MTTGWHMTIAKADLIDAIGTARTRMTLRRRKAGPEFDPWVVLAAASEPPGLSIRSADAAMDVPGEGQWPSPIRVKGAALRRLAPKLSGPAVTLSYVDGALVLGTTRLTATEI